VGEPVLPPPRISPSSGGGDVKTLLVLETEPFRDGAWDRTFREPSADRARLAVRFGVEGVDDTSVRAECGVDRSGDKTDLSDRALDGGLPKESDLRLEAIDVLLVGGAGADVVLRAGRQVRE